MSAVVIKDLFFRYGERTALDGVSFSVEPAKMFGLVGPNGGGKSTTFKILSSLLTPEKGQVTVFGEDLLVNPDRVRSFLGVVFQSPALDKKLTVLENILYQGALYGMRGVTLQDKAQRLLSQMGILDRASDRVEILSGGLKRRLEIAKALLHDPKMLILDEPTTGLDPIARREIWNYLRHLVQKEGLTILLTTHLLEEADMCESIALLNRGKVVAAGNPGDLKTQVGGDVITLKTKVPQQLKKSITDRFQVEVKSLHEELMIQKQNAPEFIPVLVKEFSNFIDSVTLGKPTLEDFFIQKTGHRFWQPEVTA